MKREEKEINQASRAYTLQLCAACINNEICKEIGLGCPRLRESIIAFSEGIKWSDEHPAKVWHQASEEPAGRDWRILCEDESGNCWVASRRDAFTIGYNWQEFAEDEALTRWAYISELLPKGGEE